MKFFNKHKMALILSGCTLLVVALLIFLGFNSGNSTAVEDAIKTTTSHVQKFFGNIGSGLYDVTHCLGELKELRNKTDELSKKNTELEKQNNENAEMAEENDRLKRMLELRQNNPDLDLAAANVTADEPSNWFSGFTIDKGKNSGLEVEQTVISSDGFLIGKISKVGTNWADVETIIDPGFSAGAMVERSKDLGVVEGDSELRYNRQFKLSYLSRDTDIEIDDYVTTTGLGGVFPAGFRLGKVAEIKDDTVTMTRYAVVNACVDFRDIRQVFVVTNNMDVVADEENANMKAARERAEQEQKEIDDRASASPNPEPDEEDEDSGGSSKNNNSSKSKKSGDFEDLDEENED